MKIQLRNGKTKSTVFYIVEIKFLTNKKLCFQIGNKIKSLKKQIL